MAGIDPVNALEVQVGRLEVIVERIEKASEKTSDHGTRLALLEAWKLDQAAAVIRSGKFWGIVLGALTSLLTEVVKPILGLVHR